MTTPEWGATPASSQVAKGMDNETGALLARLTGYQGPEEEEAIRTLVARADDHLAEVLEAQLLKSRWPVCVSLATVLYRIGTDRAKRGLIKGLSARRHHVRTAAINALVQIGDPSVSGMLEPMLDDAAFETRIAARDAIGALTGKHVKTAKGE